MRWRKTFSQLTISDSKRSGRGMARHCTQYSSQRQTYGILLYLQMLAHRPHRSGMEYPIHPADLVVPSKIANGSVICVGGFTATDEGTSIGGESRQLYLYFLAKYPFT